MFPFRWPVAVRFVLAIPSLFASFAPHLVAAEHWIRLTTPHFEMYTTNSEKQAISALNVFEQVRYFFIESNPSKTAPSTPVRIIAFKSEKEYKPYRFNEGAFAYYERSRKCDYIVMQDISPEHYQAAVHEYTHLVVEHLGMNLPIWLNEGFADLYSSLEPKGKQAMVGRPLALRVATLLSQPWLDLGTLFAVDHDSPYYNEAQKMSIFYAESWALTHMIELSERYAPKSGEFVRAIVSGKTAEESFRLIYGKSLREVTADLHSYMNQSTLRASLFNVRLAKTDLAPDTSEPSELQIELTLADLLASRKDSASEASNRLRELATRYPDNPEIEESLGYLSWQQGSLEEAQTHFGRAIQEGSKDPELMYHYAGMLQSSPGSTDAMIHILQQAIKIRPDYHDALLELGLTALRAQKFGLAVATLSQIKAVKPDGAYTLFSAMAYGYIHLKDLPTARKFAERAKQYATDPTQTEQADSVLKYVDAMQNPSPAPTFLAVESPPLGETAKTDFNGPRPARLLRHEGLQRVEGTTINFACDTKILRLQAGEKKMAFLIDDPKQIVIENTADGYFDLACGPQKGAKVTVFYMPPTAGSKVDGTIRKLVF